MRNKLQNVLCAVDFSPFSGTVLKYGREFAQRFGAHLLIAHVLPKPTDSPFGKSDPYPLTEKERSSKQIDRRIRESFPDSFTSWEAVIGIGEPVEQIRRISEERQADLIIAASHGLSGFKRLFLGTVVERLARNVASPLLVVRSRTEPSRAGDLHPLRLGRILVGCDLSADCTGSLDSALQLADAFRSKVHLLHAMERPMDESIVNPTDGPYPEVQQLFQERLRERLIHALHVESLAEERIKLVLLPGPAGEQLPLYASTSDTDLLVVGVRRRGPLEKRILGSTTEAVLRKAPCSVLVVPAPDGNPSAHGGP